MKNIIFILLIVLTFISCFKKERPITLPYGTTTISTCSMGDPSLGSNYNHYAKQMYFDLNTNTFQEKQLLDWDLSFDATDTGFGIFANTGYSIKIAKANLYNLNEPKASNLDYIADRLGNFELLDSSNGKASNSAIGVWRKYNDSGFAGKIYGIYFIELSYLSGNDRFRRLQILGSNDSFYTCKITKLDQINIPITKIPKNKTQNFTFYSFKNGGGVVDNAEPPKDMWDIEFTRYKTILHNTNTPYYVTGVLNSPNKVLVAMDVSSKFDDITANSIGNYSFTSNRDAIGYDYWKTFVNPGAGGTYIVHSNITYIIKDTDGYYYKLRFLDFNDKQGHSGNPKFEYIRIK